LRKRQGTYSEGLAQKLIRDLLAVVAFLLQLLQASTQDHTTIGAPSLEPGGVFRPKTPWFSPATPDHVANCVQFQH